MKTTIRSGGLEPAAVGAQLGVEERGEGEGEDEAAGGREDQDAHEAHVLGGRPV